MSVYDYSSLAAHVGHKIECVTYAGGENVAVECVDCNTVLLDYNREDENNE